MPTVVGFVGYSGVGKTTLALALVRRMKAQGYSVGVVKDAHCVMDLDTPGKDTARYLEVGSDQVILRTPVGWKMMTPTRERTSIDTLLPLMAGMDYVFVEGFKYEGNYPKIEVNRRGVKNERPWLMDADPTIVAVVTDRRPPKPLPTFSFDQLDALVAFVEHLA